MRSRLPLAARVGLHCAAARSRCWQPCCSASARRWSSASARASGPSPPPLCSTSVPLGWARYQGSPFTAKRGSPSTAAGQGGGYRGLAGSVEARPMVRGSPVGVSGKRGARGWGFDAGQAFGARLCRDCRRLPLPLLRKVDDGLRPLMRRRGVAGRVAAIAFTVASGIRRRSREASVLPLVETESPRAATRSTKA